MKWMYYKREKKSPADRGIIRDKAAAKQTRHGLAAWCPAYFYFLSPSDFLKEVYKKFGRELAYLGRLFQAVLESSSITKSDKVGYFSSSQLNVCIYHGIIQYILAQLFKWKVLYVVEFNGAVERSCFGAYGHIPLSTSNKMTCKVTKRKVFFSHKHKGNNDRPKPYYTHENKHSFKWDMLKGESIRIERGQGKGTTCIGHNKNTYDKHTGKKSFWSSIKSCLQTWRFVFIHDWWGQRSVDETL